MSDNPPWYSARWWLALMAGVGFLYCIVMRVLPTDAIAAIITGVFMAYFLRSDRNPSNGAALPNGEVKK